MAKIFYDDNADFQYLKNKLIAVIGYGNQGRAHALNLRDSGFEVIIGARKEGRSYSQASTDRFSTMPISEASKKADILVITLPDELIPEVYKNSIKSMVKENCTFVFAHGFAVHYKTISLPENADVILVAPTGPGKQLRSLYEIGEGLPALIAIEKNNSGNAHEICLAYAKAIGSTRAGVIETTFAEETVVDLFCEQSVLCGGIPELIKASFKTLVDKGYQPELAYISCLKEVKLIADLLFDKGMVGMKDAISTTAKYGAALSGPEIIDSRTESKLSNVLNRIEDGNFAKSFIESVDKKDSLLKVHEQEEHSSKLNKTGKELASSLRF